jgi:hypothetical protein
MERASERAREREKATGDGGYKGNREFRLVGGALSRLVGVRLLRDYKALTP